MGLHAILEAIRSEGEVRVGEIGSRAYTQAREILSQAQLDAERLKEQACTLALEPVSHERARLIHRARLESMQMTGGIRKELVDAALEQVRGRLANLRTDACYPEVIHHLLVEALSELKVDDQETGISQPLEQIYLEASPDDRGLIEGLLQALELDITVSYSLDCWGGLVVKSENGRIVVINTLEARLERAIPYLRRYLADLFERERSDINHDQLIGYQMATKP